MGNYRQFTNQRIVLNIILVWSCSWLIYSDDSLEFSRSHDRVSGILVRASDSLPYLIQSFLWLGPPAQLYAIWGVTGWCRRGAPYWVVYVYVCMLVHYWILSREEVTYKGLNTLVKQRCTEPKPPPPNLLAMLAKWSWRRIPWRDVLVNMGSVLYSVRSEETQNVLALVFRGLEISNVVWQQD